MFKKEREIGLKERLEINGWDTALVVYAHPDDELCMVGTIDWLVKNNVGVVLVVATDGGKGVNDSHNFSPKQLIAVRRIEQTNSALLLGVRELIFLGYPDQKLREMQNDLKGKLVGLFEDYRPSAVFTWTIEPRFFSNHPDHLTIREAVVSSLIESRNNSGLEESKLFGFLPYHEAATHCAQVYGFGIREAVLNAHQSQATTALRGTFQIIANEDRIDGKMFEFFEKVGLDISS